MEQREGRIDRLGRALKESSPIYYLLVKDVYEYGNDGITLALATLVAASIAAASITAQRGTQPGGAHSAGHYCKRADVPISARETRAHSCTCKYSCSTDAEGTRGAELLRFCRKNNRRCTCHVEEPCHAQGGLVDMDWTLLVVRRPRAPH